MKLKLSIVAAALALGLAPDPIVCPSAWAAENIVVPDGPYAGSRWSPEVAPYLTEILDLLAPDNPATRISVRKSAQTGLTGVGIAWLGLLIDVAPARMLAVQPTVDSAKEFNAEKLQPTIEGSPVLRRKVAPLKSRSGRGSTLLRKTYPGGSLTIAGANSTAGLRSKTIKYALCDEIDDWPEDLEGQGDPMLMVDARQLTFRVLGNYKKLEISTPTLKGSSRIDAAFEAGDQRYFHVACPNCGHEQTFTFESLRFEEAFPHQAVYVCAAQGCVIEHFEKARMLAPGRWIAAEPGPGRHPSFHIDSLYSPFVGWDDIAAAYLATKGDPHSEKGFANLWLGRSFEVEGEAPKWEELQKRAQSIASHGAGEVPAWVLFLTMGVDVQMDRLEASIWGWGVGKTSALIDHIVLEGQTNAPEVWAKLTELRVREFETANGRKLGIECTAVDSGFRPTMTYDWVRGKPHTLSVKGYSGRTDWPIGMPKKMTYTARGKLVRASALNWMVGSWYLKAEIYGYLNLEGPDQTGNFPPGFVHLASGLDDEVFKQLTAEKLVAVQKRGGLTSYEWRKSPQDRNEVLDCAVYARAAAYSPHIGMGRMTLAQWQALAIERGAPPEPAQLDMLRAVAMPAGVAVEPKPKPKAPRRAARSNWMN